MHPGTQGQYIKKLLPGEWLKFTPTAIKQEILESKRCTFQKGYIANQ